MRLIRIATRKSLLALKQSETVAKKIKDIYPDIRIEFVKLVTEGDRRLDVPLSDLGGKGLFLKELQVAMLENRADIAVHSLKDYPSQVPESFKLAAFLKRDDPSDSFISNKYTSLKNVTSGGIIGTSSLRRKALIQSARPDLNVVSLRGNLQTRLSKLDAGEYDGIILASAGLIRLGLQNLIKERLSVTEFIPAISQGIVCVEAKENDIEMQEIIHSLNDSESESLADTERTFMKMTGADCKLPVACHVSGSFDNKISIHAMIANPDNNDMVQNSINSNPDSLISDVIKLGNSLFDNGGRKILKQLGKEV